MFDVCDQKNDSPGPTTEFNIPVRRGETLDVQVYLLGLRPTNRSKKAAAELKEWHSWFPVLQPASREFIKAQSPVSKYETLPLSD